MKEFDKITFEELIDKQYFKEDFKREYYKLKNDQCYSCSHQEYDRYDGYVCGLKDSDPHANCVYNHNGTSPAEDFIKTAMRSYVIDSIRGDESFWEAIDKFVDEEVHKRTDTFFDTGDWYGLNHKDFIKRSWL